MTLTHPQANNARRDELAVQPLFGLEGTTIPRHEFPEDEMAPDVAYQIIHDELMLDGNAWLNVATFVTTWMEPQAQTLMTECFDKNMIDKDEYPQTAEIESRCVNMLSRLWHAPEADEATGARRPLEQGAMLGALALKRLWQKAARGRGQTGRPAEPRDGHQRPDLLGEVRQLLGRRDAPRADGGRPVHPLGRGGRQAVRREHDRRDRDPRLDVRRLLRADSGDL
jgi:glutamate/tyrosine decarboxylase-like PLP-dependent enzyme